MYKKILILSLLLSAGCTDSYKKVEDAEISDFLSMHIFVDRISKKIPDLDRKVRADKNLVSLIILMQIQVTFSCQTSIG